MAEVAVRPREHLDLLYQAALEFNSTLDLEELLPRVFDRIIQILDAEAGSIWLRSGDKLICRLARGPVGEEIEGLELPLGAGIVGDVARKGEAELVADARNDPRFIHQVDEATGFATRSMVAAPLKAKGEVLGVFQVLNKRSGNGQFDESDKGLLVGLAATAGMALRNAQLHEAEKRARDLRALLGISREITSTLDLDRLVLSVVNLASQAVAYDRAAIVLDEKGRPLLRAISGRETLDPKAEENRELERLITWLLERDEVAYVPEISDEEDELAPAARAAFGSYFERTGVRSFCLIPLKDEEGRLGGLYMESSNPEFLGEGGREAAELLAYQAAVAIRNATLYSQVPFISVLEPVAAWRRRIAAMPRRTLAKKVGIPAAVALAVFLIPLHERISTREAVLLPGSRMPVRATVAGVISEIRVDEGQTVEAGDILAVLRDDEIRTRLQEAEAGRAIAEREAAAAQTAGDEAKAQIARIQAQELAARLSLLRQELERTRLRAPVAGVVLTPRPRERLGASLEPGETFVVLGRTDRLEIEARVADRDIDRVRAGQRVRLKVPSRPEYTFVGTVTEIASHADPPEGRGGSTFAVRAGLENGAGLLKPGMDAKAKIVGSWRPIAALLMRPVIRLIQWHVWR
ncbi:MAG: efflux RND transporter periplasmic adaptor subunit [Gemmatimonadetes bacterium]|nr:efflux RND transporter periplasmic adaptor subunit [Gemmatimonadota bacterium]